MGKVNEKPTAIPPIVHVLSLGGTIAMIPSRDGGVVPALSADDLLATLPALDGVRLRAESFRQRPGASLGFADLLALHDRIEEVSRDGAGGVVVTQGTDTLEETAYFLDLVMQRPEPIILTGAMRPPGAPGADGAANLHSAIITASSAEARECGVLVAMDDRVHSAARVRKVRTAGPAAFASPDTGPLGWVSEGRLRMFARRNDRLRVPPIDRRALGATAVALLSVSLDEDSRLYSALPALGYTGLVVEAMGAGHVPEWLVAPLERVARQIPVVLASRTGAGAVYTGTYGFAGSETDLLARGLFSAGHLDGRKARLLLALLLAGGLSHDELGTWFARA